MYSVVESMKCMGETDVGVRKNFCEKRGRYVNLGIDERGQDAEDNYNAQEARLTFHRAKIATRITKGI